jgi:hypothetical protein
MHLIVENLVGYFFYFGSVEMRAFPFTLKDEIK